VIEDRFGKPGRALERVHWVLMLHAAEREEDGRRRPGFITWVASQKHREAIVQMMRSVAATVEADPRTDEMMMGLQDLPPHRFTTERVGPGGERFSIEQVPGASVTLKVIANGRLCGIVMLRPEEARAFVEIVHREPRT
jgi:hypothetical protein